MASKALRRVLCNSQTICCQRPQIVGARSLVSQCMDHVVGSHHQEQYLPSENLAEHVMRNWSNYGSKMALKCSDTGQSYTYEELQKNIHSMAANLKDLGIGQGDVLFLLSPNNPDYAIIYLATISIGAIITTNNPAYTSDEIAHALKLSDCKLIITASDFIPNVKAALDSLKGNHSVKETIVTDGFSGYRPLTSLYEKNFSLTHYPDVDYKEHLAALPFSSGTTGLPKGVMLSHHNIIANLIQLKEADVPIEFDDKLGGVLPFFHIYGQVLTLLLTLREGASVVSMKKFDFVKFLQMIQDDDLTMNHLVPPIILGMTKSPLTDKYDLSSLHTVSSGAAPLKVDLATQFQHKFPRTEIMQGYGLTETSPVVTFNGRGVYNKLGSIGKLIPNVKARVVDLETDKSLPVNCEGELYFHGPNIMKGYWKNQEASDDCMDGEWFRTGDIGYYDENGYFYVVDRLKELIKYKGLQVAPAELEATLLNNDKVLDCAVIGVPDDEAGELPRAYIVTQPGQELSDDELNGYMSEHLSKHKQLRGGIIRVTEIPKSPSGKILRRILKQEALKEFQ